jgi:hypothetical protein
MMDAPETTPAAGGLVQGRCLCGAVGWTFAGEIPDATICNCSACRRYGVLWAYDYDGHGIQVDDPGGKLTAFVRGPLSLALRSACGSMVNWRPGPRPTAGSSAVNLRLADRRRSRVPSALRRTRQHRRSARRRCVGDVVLNLRCQAHSFNLNNGHDAPQRH